MNWPGRLHAGQSLCALLHKQLALAILDYVEQKQKKKKETKKRRLKQKHAQY